METINYEKYLKDRTPPEDLIQWTIGKGGLKKEYLIYRAAWEYVPLEDRNRRAVSVTCTACGHSFLGERVDAGGCGRSYPSAPFGWYNPLVTEAVIDGYDTMCPWCNAQAKTLHVGSFARRIDDYCYVSELTRIPIEGKQDRLALLEWQVRRIVDKEGKSTYGTWLWSAWVVEEKKVVRLKGWQRCLSTISYTEITQRKTFLDDYGKVELMYPFEEAVLYGTTGENCKLDRYLQQEGKSLAAYLALWRKKPNVENLIMQGCGHLVEELIQADQNGYTYSRSKGIPTLPMVNWKESKPHRMLNMTKEEFQRWGKELTKDDLAKISCVRKAGIPMDVTQQLPQLHRRLPYEVERITREQPELFWKILNYTDGRGRDYTLLRDYWEMAKALEMDLDNRQVRWPKDLKAAHDRTMKAWQKRKTLILRENFEKRRQELDGLAWQINGLLIRPCATEEEMIREGKALNHCVARYAEDHAKGKTAIFFIRQTDAPDKPFFTLEWDEKNRRVVQNRGKRNCDRTPEVALFEKMWTDWLMNKDRKVSITLRRKSA